jgi:PKD repeat protein
MDPAANPTAQQMRRPETITAVFLPTAQYELTIVSMYGDPVGAGVYDPGTPVHWSVTSPYPSEAGVDGVQYIALDSTEGDEVMDAPETVTISWKTQYYLTTDSAYGDPIGAGWYDEGATAYWSVTSPYPGAEGVRYVTDTTSGEVLMESPKSVTVSWTTQYRLITAANPPERGTVLPSGENWYNAGTVVTLTATGNIPYGFIYWSGDLSGIVCPIDIVMDGQKSITANFDRPTLIIANPRWFDNPVPAVGTYTYDAGSTVSCFIASPVSGMNYGAFADGFESGTISGWTMGGTFNWFLITEEKYSGSYCARSGAVPTNASTYIQRTFAIGPGGGQVTFWWKVSSRPAYHTLRFCVDGSVVESISGVLGWTERTFSLDAGTRTLRWEYIKDWRSPQNLDRGWIDDIAVTNVGAIDESMKHISTGYAGSGSCPSGTGASVTFTIMQASCVTWQWKTAYRLSVSVTPPAGGTVTAEPLSGDIYYDASTAVALTASPNPGYGFAYWSGDLSGNENPKSLSMDGPKSVTANFAPPPVSDFTASRSIGFPPFVVRFTDTSTGIVTCWAWDFENDGTVDSTEQNPSCTYTDAGVYTVKLTATGPGGSDEEIKTDYIRANVDAWTLWAGNPRERSKHAMAYDSKRGVTVLFGGTDGNSPNDTWEWNGTNWIQRLPPVSPSARDGHAMAYDSARGVVVLFGGYSHNDTWEWDGTNWTQMSPAVNPPARYDHAMAYDSARGVVVLFGGYDASGRRNDTWEWDGTNWTQRSPAVSPSARYGHAMAYDSARGVVVLFGGYYRNDTWEWDGTTWTQKSPPVSPSKRGGHAMAYDSARGVVVLFGGYCYIVPDYYARDDTWEWNGTTWTGRSLAVRPSRRSGHAMAYDSARSVVVLFGGYYYGGGAHYYNDTYEWDGTNWTQRLLPVTPSARYGHAMAFDSAHGVVVLFGGYYREHFYDDTWERKGTDWTQRSPAVSPPGRAGCVMVYDSARGVVVLFGGYGSSAYCNDTYEWDGTNWTQRFPADSPSARHSHTMSYDSVRGVVVLFGGYGSGGNYCDDTWEWDGTDWTQMSPEVSPSGRTGCSMAYDPAHQSTVLFGGYGGGADCLNDTWEWNGINWTQSSPAVNPSARYKHAMAYDCVRGVVMLFAGWGSTFLNDTWEWDGTNWRERFPAVSPPARYDHAMAYDSARGVIVVFGGQYLNDAFDDTWEY